MSDQYVVIHAGRRHDQTIFDRWPAARGVHVTLPGEMVAGAITGVARLVGVAESEYDVPASQRR